MDCVDKRLLSLGNVVLGLVCIGLNIMCGVSGVCAELDNTSQSGLVTLDVIDADLSQVVRMLIGESNQSIVIADPSAGSKKVTVFLKNVPLEKALGYVARSAGCRWTQNPDGVYVIEPQEAPSSATGTRDTSPPLVDTPLTSHGRLTEAERVSQPKRLTKVESIKLYNTSPVDMMWALGLYKIEDVGKIKSSRMKPGVYIRRDDGTIEPMIVPGQGTPPLVESMKQDLNYAERTPSLLSEPAQAMPPVPPGFSPTVPGGVRQPTTGRQPTTPGTTPTQPGQQPQTTSGLMPEGITFIMPYEMDNSLIVRGDEEGISELKTIISMLDVAPKQISIKAEFVSIATSELNSLGINWSLDRLDTSFSTNFSPAGNVVVGYATGNVIANLRAQISSSDGKLINAPLVTTINNVPAEISFLTQVPYLNTTTIYSSTGVPTTSTWVDTFDVTSALWVLPRVNNADNSITVVVSPEISDIEKLVSTGDMQLPIVNSQRVQTVRRVANGETIVLGGLVRKDTKQSVDKIPLLGDLPLLGPLFRSVNKSTDDKELLILLTPRIVPEASVAGTGIGVIP